ncbi:MAG: cytidylate kinase family protein [Nanoarchaeota archaeon]|nr:cytidylate kinase family protein [Nanoarchaeota archaeon]MBU1321562.1 cytidylate kinase family protein [Nanoarchaeota archaeon]MBU1597096.1 cytidylate kinase family protein [Nanoarchaeota archaeon]MBU2441877.1 cytidylate kinase family protein [Nanoarchaeota archaeon]
MIITISGRAGSGKSSVGRALAKKLGYKFYSAGDVRRDFANSKGLTLAQLNEQAINDPTSDYLVDDYMKHMADSEDNFVIDAWLGFYCFPDSVKIFLEAKGMVRAKRIFERGSYEEKPKNVSEALRVINAREDCCLKRYDKLYGLENAYNYNHYDLVLDTSDNTVVQTVDEIYRFVQNKIYK